MTIDTSWVAQRNAAFLADPAARLAGNAVATILVGRWTGTADMDRVHKVLAGEIPYEASEDDSTVDMRRPDVENPATEHLQPTPQVDLSQYEGSSGTTGKN